MKICPNCHDANSCGDYEGPTCEVCRGEGKVAERDDILPFLWGAIVEITDNEAGFWLGEILLSEITKETGYTLKRDIAALRGIVKRSLARERVRVVSELEEVRQEIRRERKRDKRRSANQ